MKLIEEIDSLKEEIADMEDILSSERRVKQIIISELGDIAKKYGKPRRCEIMYEVPAVEGEEPEQQIPDYPVRSCCSSQINSRYIRREPATLRTERQA